MRDLGVGEELLVWYDDLQYDIYFGITVAGYKENSSGGVDLQVATQVPGPPPKTVRTCSQAPPPAPPPAADSLTLAPRKAELVSVSNREERV